MFSLTTSDNLTPWLPRNIKSLPTFCQQNEKFGHSFAYFAPPEIFVLIKGKSRADQCKMRLSAVDPSSYANAGKKNNFLIDDFLDNK